METGSLVLLNRQEAFYSQILSWHSADVFESVAKSIFSSFTMQVEVYAFLNLHVYFLR